MKEFLYLKYLLWFIIIIFIITLIYWTIYPYFCYNEYMENKKKVRFSENIEICEIPTRKDSFNYYL